MTVKELIEALQDFDENMEVKITYNYGDYWRTTVADKINNVDEGQVKYSSYHRTDKVSDNGDEEDETKTVVLLG